MLLNRHFVLRLFPALACAFCCACGFAQIQRPTPQDPYPMPPMTVDNAPPNSAPRPEYHPAAPAPQPRPRPAAPPAKPSPAVPANHPAAAPARPVPPSLLNQPAQPAQVSLASGKLTIEASNSSLSSILGQIAKAGGMKISGLHPNASQRVFGKYGPGAPRAVLSDLLTGSGYNVMMLGLTPAGTPRELTLSARSGGLPHPPPQASQPDQDEDNGDDSPPPEEMEEQGPPPQEEAPRPAETQDTPNANNRVRTPEQILRELQQMHQQQQPPQ